MILPDKLGFFGEYGGKYVPEIFHNILLELEDEYKKYSKDKNFITEYKNNLRDFCGRPTSLYYAKNFSKYCGNNNKIFLKREDLLHTGSHKINNTIGQVLLAKKMKKKRIIAETGAGQHGVATATAAALYGIKCVIYMGRKDTERQHINVKRIKMLGAELIPVDYGTKTLKEAVTEAFRDWIVNFKTTNYVLGSAVGPHPFPLIVRNFQKIIGEESKKQLFKQFKIKSPDYVIACVGGGSNSIGIFYDYIKNKNVKLIGVEAGGIKNQLGFNSASISFGKNGILHGSKSKLLQTQSGQIADTHSIAAGLDYPGVGPEHSYLYDSGRANYTNIKDKEAQNAFKILSKTEGIIPAFESSHALAYTLKLTKKIKNKNILICLSGRGDKDL